MKEFPRFTRQVRLESLTVPGAAPSLLRLVAAFSIAYTAPRPRSAALDQDNSEPFVKHGGNPIATADPD
jgi:hypothetical protein